MRTAKVTLGGVEYEIGEQRSRKNAEWRKSLQAEFGAIFDVLLGSQSIQIENADDLLKIVAGVAPSILASVDKIAALMFAYSPTLAADRARIEEEAYDGEIVEAFIGVLGLAYPFGGMLQKIGALTGGSADPLRGSGPAAPAT